VESGGQEKDAAVLNEVHGKPKIFPFSRLLWSGIWRRQTYQKKQKTEKKFHVSRARVEATLSVLKSFKEVREEI
jgi:hypothetical protein